MSDLVSRVRGWFRRPQVVEDGHDEATRSIRVRAAVYGLRVFGESGDGDAYGRVCAELVELDVTRGDLLSAIGEVVRIGDLDEARMRMMNLVALAGDLEDEAAEDAKRCADG